MTAYPEEQQLELLRDEVRRFAGLQNDEIEGLDRKGTTILAANGVILGLVVSNIEEFHGVAGWSPVLFNVSLIGLGVGLLVGVFQLWPRDFKVVSEPEPLWKRYYAKPWNETISRVTAAMILAIHLNKPLSDSKALLLKAQMGMLVSSAGLLIGAYLVKELLP